MTAVFLTLDEVLKNHAHQIATYGGSLGIRDVGLLESGLAMPEAAAFGEELHATLHEKAAAYLFHLVKNHPFIDGNKRVGLAVSLTFLELNGVWVQATEAELVELVEQAGFRVERRGGIFPTVPFLFRAVNRHPDRWGWLVPLLDAVVPFNALRFLATLEARRKERDS